MIELLINGQLVTGINEILLTKAVSDIGTISSREGEYSTTIEVPPTKSNLTALNYTQQFGNIVSLGSKRLEYELYESGVLISGGLARVLKVKETLSIVLFGGNSDWLAQIGDATLQELDVDNLNVVLGAFDVRDNRLNTTGFVFPNAWYDAVIPGSHVFGFNDFRPAFYVNYLINKMFDALGYAISGDILSNAIYNKIVIPFTNKYWKKRSLGKAYSGRPFVFSPLPIDALTNTSFLGIDIVYFADDNEYFSASGEWSLFSSGLYFRISFDPSIPTTKEYEYNITFNIPLAQPAPISFSLKTGRLTGGGVLYDTQTLETQSVSASGDYQFVGTATLNEGVFDNGRVFYIEFSTALTGTIMCTGGVLSIVGYDYEIEQPINQWTDFRGALPKTKQSDLLLTIVNQFNLLFTTDNLNKAVAFVSFDKVRENIPQAIDWSDKIDLSEAPEILFDFFDNYFKKNNFSYKIDDKDPYISGTTIGQGTIETDNENLEIEGDVFVSEFSPVERVDMLSIELPIIPINGISGELNPKIATVEITNNNIVTQSPFSAPTQSAELFFDPLGFDVLIPANYQILSRILANNKAIKLLIRLSRADFANVDFSIPIFLDIETENGQIRGHFFINQIDQYSVGANESCEVTLINID